MAQALLPRRFPVHNPADQSHAHQLRQAGGSHLRHHVRAVYLDGSRADRKVESDDLVGLAGGQPFQDLALAIRQRGETGFDLRQLGITAGILLRTVERRPNRPEQMLVLEWLFQKVGGTDFHRFHGKWHTEVKHRLLNLDLVCQDRIKPGVEGRIGEAADDRPIRSRPRPQIVITAA